MCPAIYAAIRKYGWETFKVEVLAAGIPVSHLNFWEGFFVKACGSLAPGGYNLGPGGNANVGVSAQTRERLSQAIKAVYATPEMRAKVRVIRKEVTNRPGVKAAHSRSMSRQMQQPSFREVRNAAFRAAVRRPDIREKRSRDRKAAWERPEYREKQQAAWARRKARADEAKRAA